MKRSTEGGGVYGVDFFTYNDRIAVRSASVVIPLLLSHLQVRSVVEPVSQVLLT